MAIDTIHLPDEGGMHGCNCPAMHWEVARMYTETKSADTADPCFFCDGSMGADPGWDPTPKGGGLPPPTHPKMVVQNNGFWGRQRRRRFCFRHTAGGNFFVRPFVSILKILKILWRI